MVGQHTHSVSVCNYEESRNNWEKCAFYVKVRLSLISKSALQKKERKKSLYKHWVARTDRQRALFHSATFICLLVSQLSTMEVSEHMESSKLGLFIIFSERNPSMQLIKQICDLVTGFMENVFLHGNRTGGLRWQLSITLAENLIWFQEI